jgi:hypothetical protein
MSEKSTGAKPGKPRPEKSDALSGIAERGVGWRGVGFISSPFSFVQLTVSVYTPTPPRYFVSVLTSRSSKFLCQYTAEFRR